MTKLITVPRIITNGFCVARPQYIFLYGYDVQDKSWGGHSLIKGHENTFPVPTMFKFCNSGARYFADADRTCIQHIRFAIDAIKLDGRSVIPLRKMGQGCSRLQELAPRTFQFLQDELKKISYPNIRWDYNGVYENEY